MILPRASIVVFAYPCFIIQNSYSTIFPLAVDRSFLRRTSVFCCSAAKFFVSVTHIWLLDTMSSPLFNDCLSNRSIALQAF